MGGVLALDLGRKKTGVAVCDALRLAVHALPRLDAGGDDPAIVTLVRALLAEREIDLLLVGLPLHARGREGDQSAWTRAAAARLAAALALPLALHDEHLTTKEAESRLRDQGVRGPDLARLRDSAAALVLLEDWLAAGEPRGAGLG